MMPRNLRRNPFARGAPAAMVSIGWQKAYESCCHVCETSGWECGTARSFRDQHHQCNADGKLHAPGTRSAGSYFINKSLTPSLTPSNPGGHSHHRERLGAALDGRALPGGTWIFTPTPELERHRGDLNAPDSNPTNTSRSLINSRDHWEDNHGRNLRRTTPELPDIQHYVECVVVDPVSSSYRCF
jgi:hypothetical protein